MKTGEWVWIIFGSKKGLIKQFLEVVAVYIIHSGERWWCDDECQYVIMRAVVSFDYAFCSRWLELWLRSGTMDGSEDWALFKGGENVTEGK